MDFLRAGLSEDLHDLSDRRAADDGVVDEHDPLVLDRRPNRIQLEHDADLALLLVGHDESALDVAVLDEPLDDREARELRVPWACARPDSGTGTMMSASTGYSF